MQSIADVADQTTPLVLRMSPLPHLLGSCGSGLLLRSARMTYGWSGVSSPTSSLGRLRSRSSRVLASETVQHGLSEREAERARSLP